MCVNFLNSNFLDLYPNLCIGILSDVCSSGYYCDGNATNSIQHICPPGNYCPEGSFEPQPCEDGYFSNYSGAAICDICPAGYSCGSRDEAIPCITGSYCPEGTGRNLTKCPPGNV